VKYFFGIDYPLICFDIVIESHYLIPDQDKQDEMQSQVHEGVY